MRKHLHIVEWVNWNKKSNAFTKKQSSQEIKRFSFIQHSLKRNWTFVFLLLASIGFSQSYNMDGTNITDCSGFFYDSGGSIGDYGSSESFTTTICSDATSGTHVQLIFSAVDLVAGDALCFFDGIDTNAPALSCNTDFMAGSPFIIQATAANTTGCLTITFDSDGTGESAGWQADMNCIPSCQTILADLVSSDPIVSPPDTGYIDICQGERVFFNGAGIYPQNGVVYNHSDFTSSFEWDFGDGTIGLGPNVSHIYEESGGYIVQLTITDQFGCTNTNFLNQRVRVSTNPSFAITGVLPESLCAADTIELNAVVNQTDSAFVVGVMPNEGSFPTSGVRSDSLALPDGTGVAYETSIGFSNFSPGQVLTSVDDLLSICVVMEHSWMRDLEISIECPDGTSIILHDHPGNFGSEVFLGEPFEADENLAEPIPGVGYEYCWTPDATNGTWIDYANTTGVGTLPAGNYSSFDPMSNLLGCPMNGEWTIHVEDLWGIDNGFIFEWSIEFDPSLYPDIETFTPEIINYNWLDNPSIFFQTNDSIAAAPQNAGTASYTFVIEDNFGCTYDTSVFVTILPPTHPDCFECPPPEQSLQDTTICDGGAVQVNAENTTALTNQDITFEAFPTYPIGNANHPPNNPYLAPLEITSINPTTITNAEAQICGICLDLETDFTGDIRLFIQSPSGQTMELSTNNGGAGDNYTNTCFSPTASLPITGFSAPFTGTFIPEGDWSDLNGSTINGNWSLMVSDAFGINNVGLLNSWSICFNTENDIQYSWSPIVGLSCYDCPDPLANPTNTSTFIVDVSDDFGCNYADTMTVNILSNIAAPTDVVCDTLFDGNLSFIWNGVPGFTDYMVNIGGAGWIPANNGTGHIINGLTNGDEIDIEVQVNAGNANCNVGIATTSCTYFLCDISLEVAANGITSPTCFNTLDGGVIVQAMGNGTGPFVYQIDSELPQFTPIFNGVSAGDHSVVLMDVDGCTDTVSLNIPSTDSIFVNIVSDSVSCFGTNSGSATATGVGGASNFNYAWNTTPVFTFDATIDGVLAGDYTVTVTDGNGCQVESTVTIEEPTFLEATINAINVNCFEGNDGNAIVTPTGGVLPYSYLWSNGQATVNVSNLIANSYTVTVTDGNNCTTEVTQIITEPAGMVLTLAPTDVACFGENSGNIDLTVMGGATPYNFLWNDNSTDEDKIDLVADTYCVTVTDNNGCQQDTCITIGEPAEVTLMLASTPTTCMGNNMDGTATVVAQGGTGISYSYLWSDNQMNSTAINLVFGTYTVTVIDGAGCIAIDQVDVIPPALITIDSIIPTDVLCNGGSSGIAEVFASGGNGAFTYLWSDPLAQFSNPSNSLLAGTYTVTVTDAAMCTATASVLVGEPDVLATSILPTDVNCFGGNDGVALANSTGGIAPYTYLWNSLPGQMTQEASNLTMGGYTVTVSDANGCTTTQTTLVNQPATAVTAVATQTFEGCFNENNSVAMVMASGGTGTNYTYAWNNSPASNNTIANNLSPQAYSVTVTDINGCEAITTVNISELEEIAVNIIQIEPSCNGDADGQLGVNIVTGGIGGGDLNNYNFAWDNNVNNVINQNIAAGDYEVTVTDAQGCSNISAISLDEPSLINANAAIDDANCFGSADGQIEVAATGDFPIITYEWDNNANNQMTPTATELAAGNYLVTITDDTNCSIVTSFAVGQPTEIEVAFEVEDNPCFGDNLGTIATTTTGGTPDYTYDWTNKDTTNIFSSIDQNISELYANLYTVEITDGNGCVKIDSVNLNSPPEVWAVLESDSVTCFGDSDGIVFVEGQGGQGPYTYSLDGEEFSPSNTFLGLEVGGYTTYIRDRNGCEIDFAVNVGGPEEIIVDLGEDINIDLRQPALLNSTVTPPANYIYSWSPDDRDSLTCLDCPNPSVFGLTYQTTFQLVVENEYGCKAKDLVTVFVNKDRRVAVPTGFAPNGDAKNQILRTHGREGTIVTSFKVYSRWGELLYGRDIPYEINTDGIGWDGTFKGKEMNPGVYVWHLEVLYVDGAREAFKGHTTLVR